MPIVRSRYRNLRTYFKKTNTPLGAFARHVGVDRSYISHILSGRKHPSLKVAAAIAEEAQIPIESLLEVNSD